MKPEDVNLDNHPDYLEINLPEHKSYDEYHYTERRKLILDLMIKKGTPWLKQTRLASQFNISDNQISKDTTILKVYLSENIGKDFESVGAVLYRNAIEELQSQGDLLEAVKVFSEFKDFLFETGRRDKEPNRHEVQTSVENDFGGLMDDYPNPKDGGDGDDE